MTRFLSGLTVLILLVTWWAEPVRTQERPAAQPRAEQPAAAPNPASALTQPDARETREELQMLLQKYPPELGRILKMDPTMLQNEAYLAQYPALQAFLAAHPEIVRNPGFYLEFVRQSYDWTEPYDPKRQAVAIWRDLLEGMSVFVVMLFVGGLFAWLVRTLLDHRRWQRISRVQTEVHNKLLDRFAGTEELLAYVKTPAGQRFLEAAPIPLEGTPARGIAAPLGRILWSVQVGVVLAVGGIGFQFISGRVIDEVAGGLWTIGVLAIAFGIGFILSGIVSYFLSRQFGLLDPAPPVIAAERGDAFKG